MVHWARRRLQEPDEAEDIVAISIGRLWQRMQRPPEVEHPGAYLWQTVRRAVADRNRDRSRSARLRRMTLSLEEGETDLDIWQPVTHIAQAGDEPTLRAPDPAERYARIERRDALIDAMRRLPGQQGICLYMRYFVGLSTRETARQLRIRDNAARALQHRAIVGLRGMDGLEELAA